MPFESGTSISYFDFAELVNSVHSCLCLQNMEVSYVHFLCIRKIPRRLFSEGFGCLYAKGPVYAMLRGFGETYLSARNTLYKSQTILT